MTARDSNLAALACQHLPPTVADRWTALLRPGLRLRHARPGERAAGQLGGLPTLPDDVPWPHWTGHGPMSFITAIDCGGLPADQLDIATPQDGTLLFFHRDSDQHPDEDMVGPWAPEAQAAAMVVHVPAGAPTAERQAPPDTHVYGRVALAAEPVTTGPDWEHPALKEAIRDLPADERAFMQDPRNSDPFGQAMGEQVTRPLHRFGGYAWPIQGAVEVEAAEVVFGGQVDHTDPGLCAEARRWVLLAQIDSDEDAGMMWGDSGTLYWLIRPDDLYARRFDKAILTWQCA